jgi:hypothetical protein
MTHPAVASVPISGLGSSEKSQLYMNLSIVRGPLPQAKNQAILEQYNRLSGARIPMSEFRHWIEDGPAGPAWHALLENEVAEVVGHSALIPFRSSLHGRWIVAGKAEYAFIREAYQAAKIRGYEKSGKPRNAVMVQQLFQRWQQEGLGPLLVSTSAVRQRSLSGVGCALAKFPVTEALLVLRPWNASRETPNLEAWQRVSIGVAGISQKTLWSALRLVPDGLLSSQRSRRRPESALPEANGQMAFFEDFESAQWRYPREQYEQIAADADGEQYVIVKRGSSDRYVRVCDSKLASGQPTFRLIAKLTDLARRDHALGVRWAVYGNDEPAAEISNRLRRFGFLCAPRTRTVLLYSQEKEFLSAERWKLNDAMFSFDP